MIMKVPVEGNPGLFRDSETGAIINCSDREFEEYINAKNKKLIENTEFDNLKHEVKELKDMMKLIISKLDATT